MEDTLDLTFRVGLSIFFGMSKILNAVILLGATALPAVAAAQTEPLADNSFLIEEAYNQGRGVVQHIGLWAREAGGDWAFSFTDEWPAPNERHQLSFSATVINNPDVNSRFGDTLLNYRYGVPLADPRFAFAPRISVILPTGDVDDGTGFGATGVQVNFPLSVELSDRFVTHSNLGATYLPDAEAAVSIGTDRFDIRSVNLGQSLIWRAAPRFNPMLEVIWIREELDFGGAFPNTQTAAQGFALAGVRWGHDFANGLQIVPGIAYARGFDDAEGEERWLVYLSIEHFFLR